MMVLMNPSPGIGAYAHQTPKNVVMFLLIRPSTSTETVRIHPTSTYRALSASCRACLLLNLASRFPASFTAKATAPTDAVGKTVLPRL